MMAALIGKDISDSLTPAMHEAEGAAQGLSYLYSRMDLGAVENAATTLAQALDNAQAAGLAGINITYPFKQDVLRHLDEISLEAAELAAVNTVVFQHDRRVGHNTDYGGYRQAFEADIADLSKDSVILLGAGGAGAAVGLALIDSGVVALHILDISEQRAEALCLRLSQLRPKADLKAITPNVLRQSTGYDGLVNATPMGMASHPGMAIDFSALQPRHWVSDIVYFPLKTALLQAAEARGLYIMSGQGMAVGQAALSFQLFTGLTPDQTRMAAEFNRLQQGARA